MNRTEASANLQQASHELSTGEAEVRDLERSALAFSLAYLRERHIIDDATVVHICNLIELDDTLYPEEPPL